MVLFTRTIKKIPPTKTMTLTVRVTRLKYGYIFNHYMDEILIYA